MNATVMVSAVVVKVSGSGSAKVDFMSGGVVIKVKEL